MVPFSDSETISGTFVSGLNDLCNDRLKSMSLEAVQEKELDELMDEDDMVVKFNFINNGEDQSEFQ